MSKLAGRNVQPPSPPRSGGLRVCLCAALLLAQAGAQTTGPALSPAFWRVRLLAPLSTDFNRKGDMLSARVIEPAAYQGIVLEGVIREIKAGGPAGKDSAVQFEFHTLHAAVEDMMVTAALVGAANSRGEAGMDEAGRQLTAGSHALGGMPEAGASRHWASGPVRLSVRAGHLSLAAGSVLVLDVRTRQNR